MGEEFGPVSLSELKRLAEEGTVSADAFVRKGKDGDWICADRLNFDAVEPLEDEQQVGQQPAQTRDDSVSFRCSCGESFRVKAALAGKRARCQKCGNRITIPEPTPAAAIIPPARPELASEAEDEKRRVSTHQGINRLDSVETKQYDGIGRASYFFANLGINGLSTFGNYALSRYVAGGAPAMVLIGLLLHIGAVVWMFSVTVGRLRNIGMSGWWSLLMLFFPVGTIIINVGCLILPQGYRNTRKLDTAAEIIAGIIIVFPLSLLLLLFFAMAAS
jgi:uncharacterized membrane protein YhaH (DUF805 family)